ncbi:hypothetical protein EVA_21200 [gut metagenome]|uniref:Uncharacterized protein n=1 Tax=gut metagenome TaxID=749906 RepID=J9F8B1_9ZZZZ
MNRLSRTFFMFLRSFSSVLTPVSNFFVVLLPKQQLV